MRLHADRKVSLPAGRQADIRQEDEQYEIFILDPEEDERAECGGFCLPTDRQKPLLKIEKPLMF